MIARLESCTNGTEKKNERSRSGLDYLDRAVSWCLLTGAVPLQPGTGPFVCCISALDRFEPHCATWARAASAVTPMLMLNLVRAPAQHRNTNIQESQPQTLHQTSPWKQLQLQPRATVTGNCFKCEITLLKQRKLIDYQ